MAIRRAQRQRVKLTDARAQIRWRPYADADQFFAKPDRSGEAAAQFGFELARHRIRIEPVDGRAHAIHAHIDGVAGDLDSIENLDHAGYFSNGCGDFGRRVAIDRRILAKNLDFDGLRRGHQVADQVFHQLRGFDAQARHLRGDFRAHLAHHVFDAAPRRWLQVHEEIALVRFGQAAAELQSGAARIIVDFGRGLDDGLDLAQQAVGFGQ